MDSRKDLVLMELSKKKINIRKQKDIFIKSKVKYNSHYVFMYHLKSFLFFFLHINATSIKINTSEFE